MYIGVRLNDLEQRQLSKIVIDAGEEKITSTLLKRLALRYFMPLLTQEDRQSYNALSHALPDFILNPYKPHSKRNNAINRRNLTPTTLEELRKERDEA